MIKSRAIENEVFIIAPAQCGKNTSSRKTWGHSFVVNPKGKVLCDLENKIGYRVINLNTH